MLTQQVGLIGLGTGFNGRRIRARPEVGQNRDWRPSGGVRTTLRAMDTNPDSVFLEVLSYGVGEAARGAGTSLHLVRNILDARQAP
jgi:hypothetical protein